MSQLELVVSWLVGRRVRVAPPQWGPSGSGTTSFAPDVPLGGSPTPGTAATGCRPDRGPCRMRASNTSQRYFSPEPAWDCTTSLTSCALSHVFENIFSQSILMSLIRINFSHLNQNYKDNLNNVSFEGTKTVSRWSFFPISKDQKVSIVPAASPSLNC